MKKHGIQRKKVRSKKEMKRIGIIVLAVVLVLGLLGVAYAWTAQNATINGYAVTGQTAGGFWYGSGGQVPFTITDAAGISHTVTSVISNSPGYDTLALTIDNLYPGCTITNQNLFAVWNYGTIPCTAVSATCTYAAPQVVYVVFNPPGGSMAPGTGNGTWGTGSITMGSAASMNPTSTYQFTVQVAFTSP